MAQNTGRSPLEGLKHHYDTAYSACPSCGHEDADGGWVVETDGADARYTRQCPSCGAVQERTVSLR